MKKLPDWAPTVIISIIVFLSAYFLGSLVSNIARMNFVVPQSITLARESVENADAIKPLSFYENRITPILGTAPEQPKKNNEENSSDKNEEDAPEDNMNWKQMLNDNNSGIKLTGTVVGPDTSLAFFNIREENISLYFQQEVGGYRVDSILRDSVVFVNVNDENEFYELRLFGEQQGHAKKTASPVSVAPGTKKGNDELDDIISYQGNKRVVDRRKFNALLKPPSRLANEIKFIPFSKDGQPYGIKISYLKPRSFFTKIGLKSGDILIKTNKKVLSSVEDSF